MIKDLYNRLEVENTIIPQEFTDTDDVTGETVDIVGFRRIAIAVQLGSLTADGITVTLQGQDEDDNWQDIDNDDLIGDIGNLEEIEAANDEAIHKFGLKTGKYQAVRAVVDADTESGAGDVAVTVLKAKKYDEPV